MHFSWKCIGFVCDSAEQSWALKAELWMQYWESGSKGWQLHVHYRTLSLCTNTLATDYSLPPPTLPQEKQQLLLTPWLKCIIQICTYIAYIHISHRHALLSHQQHSDHLPPPMQSECYCQQVHQNSGRTERKTLIWHDAPLSSRITSTKCTMANRKREKSTPLDNGHRSSHKWCLEPNTTSLAHQHTQNMPYVVWMDPIQAPRILFSKRQTNTQGSHRLSVTKFQDFSRIPRPVGTLNTSREHENNAEFSLKVFTFVCSQQHRVAGYKHIIQVL